jgi:hypothetical protein
MGPTNPNRQDGGPCLIAALLYAQAVVGFAQPTVSSADLARCAEIAQDVARLACFDTLVQRRGDDRRTESERTANDSAEASSQVENEDAFGAELLGGRETLGPDEIESRLIGEFTGWRGNTTFRLENSQVWRQAEEGRLVFRSTAPLITIRRGAFGTYRLGVEGINRSVRVRRLE